jgi:hypothetical protein
MANHIPRTISRPVQLRANNSTNIADSDLHSVGGCALRLPADIDGWPGESERDGRVDAGGRKESAYVGDSGLGFGVGVAEEDAVADDGDCGWEEDEGASAGVAFGDDGVDDCEAGGESLERC